MSYAFGVDEKVRDAVTRTIGEQIALARSALHDEHGSAASRVHEIRKCMKRARACARMARGAFAGGWRGEDRRLRDVGRLLAPLRDADMQCQTLERLRDRIDDESGPVPQVVRHAVETMRAWRDSVYTETGGLAAVTPKIARGLDRLERRLGRWPLRGGGFRVLVEGLDESYRRGRRAYRRAARSPSPGRIHEWRKWAKYHWYHTRLLQPTWPDTMTARATALDRLGEALGGHHDLAVLEASFAKQPALADPDRAVLHELIVREQTALVDRTHSIGARLYVESPGRLCDRLAAYWDVWRKDGVRPPSPPPTGRKSEQDRTGTGRSARRPRRESGKGWGAKTGAEA